MAEAAAGRRPAREGNKIWGEETTGTRPTEDALGEVDLTLRRWMGWARGWGARSQGSRQQVPTWAECRLSQGRAPGSQSAGAASPPRRPSGSWALPRRRQPRGYRPCLPPARRSRLPADLPAAGPRVRLRSSTPRPRRGPTALTAGPGTPWAGPIPGSPLTASQSWVGKGSLARRRLRAGRQVSAGTGRDAGRDPCLVPTHFRPRPCREGRVPGSPVPQTPSPGPPRVLPGSPPGPRLRQPAAPL